MRNLTAALNIIACLCMGIPHLGHAQNTLHSTHKHDHKAIQTPIFYRIAEVDPRFNLSIQQVIQLTQQAADIWHQETGKQHFIYDPEASFSIHLIYDERQQQSSHRLQSLDQIHQQQQRWEHQNQQLQQARAELEKNNALLAIKQNQLQAQFQQYNADVKHFNQQRSSSKSLADQLAQRQQALHQQSKALQQEVNLHNLKAQQLNQEIKKLNDNNQLLVSSAQRFNQVFKPRLFHKGNFNGKQITIYEFSSTDDLRLTLAHEFGHALGLPHTDDPTSLMYPVIQQQNLQRFALTQSDKALVKAMY
ncbi:matrixin family metalloprotease [Acinetobacter haemolyticus]|uniref:matrixin family metalloprotease n=1 Tax=Acinetobacter haemolyticus TaxID=29430 RepID=UPI000A8A41E8|nr:matrixin family metalloprotease [Acinetobacter haemolyticus]QHI27724.1 matrixin [Acinetobacter haemolyticus]